MRNIIFICLDSVRKDFFDEYALRLQEQADTVFQQARAASGWSPPSHASIFTGKLPHEHGVHSHSPSFGQINQSETFLSRLPEYTSIGISANGFISKSFKFDSLFDEFSEVNSNLSKFDSALSPQDTEVANYTDYIQQALRDSQPIRSLVNGVLTKVSLYEFLFRGRPWPELEDFGAKNGLKTATSLINHHESDNNPVFVFMNLMEAHSPDYVHRDLDSDLHSVPYSWCYSNSAPDANAYQIGSNPEEYRDYLTDFSHD